MKNAQVIDLAKLGNDPEFGPEFMNTYRAEIERIAFVPDQANIPEKLKGVLSGKMIVNTTRAATLSEDHQQSLYLHEKVHLDQKAGAGVASIAEAHFYLGISPLRKLWQTILDSLHPPKREVLRLVQEGA